MKSGSKIEGFWVFFPSHGGEHARRFENLEDAQAYIPIKKQNKQRKIPLGERWIMRVAWTKKGVKRWWGFEEVERLSQDEVDELFMKMAAEVASAES